MKIEDNDIKYIVYLVLKMKKEKFSGNVQINFRCGGISNINKLESIRKEDFIVIS